MNGHVNTPDAHQDLVDLIRLWQVDPRGFAEELVASQGLPDGQSYAALSSSVADLAVAHDIDELSGVEAQDAAVAAMCRRLSADVVTPRELTYWVTRVIGWRGSASTQPFLALEDDYCDVPLTDEELADLDDRVRDAACVFLRPDADASPERASGLRGRITRWRSRRS